MEEKFKEIEAKLNRLHDLQARHLETFCKEELPDLEKQTEESNHEVKALLRSITEFVKMAKNKNEAIPESNVLLLNKKFASLLDQNKTLEAKVQGFRNNIKKGMKKISTGKQVIGSYRSPAAVLNNPKVLSITN